MPTPLAHLADLAVPADLPIARWADEIADQQAQLGQPQVGVGSLREPVEHEREQLLHEAAMEGSVLAQIAVGHHQRVVVGV